MQLIRTLALVRLVMLTVLLVSFSAWANADDKAYQITKLDVSIKLQEDGTMAVTEKRTYQFQGSFSHVYRTFPLEGRFDFLNIRIIEDGKRFQLTPGKAPGTMSLDTTDEQVKATAYFEAENTSRTFDFEFTADGALKRYEDAATLDYQVISDEWEKDTRNITVTIIPPENINQEQVEQWVHGNLKAESKVTPKGNIRVNLEHLPEDHQLRVRALFPQELFTEMPQKGETIRKAFREQSENLIKEARLARKRKGYILNAIIPYIGLLIVFWVWLFRKYRQKPQVKASSKDPIEPPSQHKPAAINYLIHYEIAENEVFSATLFDLANRGFISMGHEEDQNFLGFDTSKAIFYLNRSKWEQASNDLTNYEYNLLEFLFDKLADENDRFTSKTLEKEQGNVHEFLQSWKSTIKNSMTNFEWYDQTSRKGRTIGFGVSITLMGVMLIAAIFYSPYMLILGLSTLPFFIASFFILHRTRRGLQLYHDWQAFKTLLKERRYQDHSTHLSEKLFYQYLIYGLALGLSESNLKQLAEDFEALFPNAEPHFLTGIENTQAAVGQTMNTVFAATVIAATTATGGGAGAGGGSGGGGAG